MTPVPEPVLIVIPCYNEAARLPVDQFSAFLSEGAEYEFLFVNDGSTDNTADILQSAVTLHPGRFHFLNLTNNGGKAEAVRQGMLFGRNLKSYAYFGFLDADLATPLRELPYMVRYASFIGSGKTFIFGSRIKILGSHIDRDPVRHYFGRISATGASICLNLPVYDTQCGVKLFHSSIVNTVFTEEFSSRWLFDVEIFFRLKAHYDQASFYDSALEVPIRNWKEIAGTKIKLSDIVKVPFELYRIYRRYSGFTRF